MKMDPKLLAVDHFRALMILESKAQQFYLNATERIQKALLRLALADHLNQEAKGELDQLISGHNSGADMTAAEPEPAEVPATGGADYQRGN